MECFLIITTLIIWITFLIAGKLYRNYMDECVEINKWYEFIYFFVPYLCAYKMWMKEKRYTVLGFILIGFLDLIITPFYIIVGILYSTFIFGLWFYERFIVKI